MDCILFKNPPWFLGVEDTNGKTNRVIYKGVNSLLKMAVKCLGKMKVTNGPSSSFHYILPAWLFRNMIPRVIKMACL